MCRKELGLHGKKQAKTTKKSPAKKQAKIKKSPVKQAPKYTAAEKWFFRNEDVLY